MAYCGKCGQLIHWIRTVTEVLLPIDPAPLPNGNLMRLSTGKFRVLEGDELARYPGPVFKSHHETCREKGQPR